MLRLVEVGNALPISYPVDPTAVFQPGQLAQLKVAGNEVVVGVSDGTAPIGILDDIKSSAFTRPSKDEIVIINTGPGADDGYGTFRSTMTVEQTLKNANIVDKSFVSPTVPGLILNSINGSLIAPAGFELNFDADGDGVPDAIRAVVSYIYRVPNIPGDNSTAASKRATIWFTRGIFETDQYDTTRAYTVNALLFSNSDGLLTSVPESNSSPGIAICTGPPTSLVSTIEFMWL